MKTITSLKKMLVLGREIEMFTYNGKAGFKRGIKTLMKIGYKI